MPHDHLTVADVLDIHSVLIKRFGGDPGVRDAGALEATLFRPQTGYYDDIVAEAAALMKTWGLTIHSWTETNALHLRRPMSSCGSMAGT